MPEVADSVVIFGDGGGMECPALVKAIHERDNTQARHPWLTLQIVSPDPNRTDEVRGVKSRQTEPRVKVPHQSVAGPAPYWRYPKQYIP